MKNEKKPMKSNRWLLLILGVIIFMCMGTVYSWSVFRKPLEDALKIDATASGLPYMLFLASYALLMPVTGGLIEKYGPRVIMMLGGVIVGVGWVLSGYANHISTLAVTYGILAGGGVGIVYGAPIAAVSRWFPDKKGLAVGINLAGFGLSPFVTAPFSERLIEHFGPFATFRILGLLFLLIIPLLSLPFHFPPETGHQREGEVIRSREAMGRLVRNPRFVGLWICFMLGTFVGLMTIGITSPVAEEVIAIPSAAAAWYISFFAICNGLGRPLFGWLTDRTGPYRAALLSYGFILISAVFMVYSGEGSVVLYFLAFSLLWLTLGGWLAIAPTATAIFFGTANHTKNYGYIFTAYGVGAVLGNFVSGEIRRLTGSYTNTFYPILLAAVLGIAAASIFFRKRRHRREGLET